MYNQLYAKILDSSIWLEDAHVRLVWITFLAAKDKDGVVALSSIGNVALRARVTLEQAEEALTILESPDTKNPDQDYEGRRIERIPGVGWVVLNSDKYDGMAKAVHIRAKTRERVKLHRAKKAGNAPVTLCNDSVTPSVSVSESISISKKKKTTEAVVSVAKGDPVGFEVISGLVISGLLKRMGLKGFTIPVTKEWQKAIRWAVANDFTSEDILECYDLLTQQDWRDSAVGPKALTKELPNLATLRSPKRGKNNEKSGANIPRRTTLDRIADHRDILSQYPSEAELRGQS